MAAEKEEMAKQGLAEAIDKLEAAPNERSAQVQLGNALKWIHSLEEWHKLRLGKRRPRRLPLLPGARRDP
jgi:hypothetical protein